MALNLILSTGGPCSVHKCHPRCRRDAYPFANIYYVAYGSEYTYSIEIFLTVLWMRCKLNLYIIIWSRESYIKRDCHDNVRNAILSSYTVWEMMMIVVGRGRVATGTKSILYS